MIREREGGSKGCPNEEGDGGGEKVIKKKTLLNYIHAHTQDL